MLLLAIQQLSHCSPLSLITVKIPVVRALEETSASVQKRMLKALVEWAPRESNKEAGALANGETVVFSPALEMKVDVKNFRALCRCLFFGVVRSASAVSFTRLLVYCLCPIRHGGYCIGRSTTPSWAFFPLCTWTSSLLPAAPPLVPTPWNSFKLVQCFSIFSRASLQVRDISSGPLADPITSEGQPSLLLRLVGSAKDRLSVRRAE